MIRGEGRNVHFARRMERIAKVSWPEITPGPMKVILAITVGAHFKRLSKKRPGILRIPEMSTSRPVGISAPKYFWSVWGALRWNSRVCFPAFFAAVRQELQNRYSRAKGALEFTHCPAKRRPPGEPALFSSARNAEEFAGILFKKCLDYPHQDFFI